MRLCGFLSLTAGPSDSLASRVAGTPLFVAKSFTATYRPRRLGCSSTTRTRSWRFQGRSRRAGAARLCSSCLPGVVFAQVSDAAAHLRVHVGDGRGADSTSGSRPRWRRPRLDPHRPRAISILMFPVFPLLLCGVRQGLRASAQAHGAPRDRDRGRVRSLDRRKPPRRAHSGNGPGQCYFRTISVPGRLPWRWKAVPSRRTSVSTTPWKGRVPERATSSRNCPTPRASRRHWRPMARPPIAPRSLLLAPNGCGSTGIPQLRAHRRRSSVV